MDTQKSCPKDGLLVPIMAVLASIILLLWAPFASRVAWQQTQCCFLSVPGFFIAIVFTAVLVFIGKRVFRAAIPKTGSRKLLLISFIAVDLLVGLILFEEKGMSHAMFRWGVYQYMKVAGDNMLWSFPPTAFIILTQRPWRFVEEAGLFRVVCAACALLLLNYFVAYLGYALSPLVSVE